uniref:Mitochondrial tRNA methylthiotransferase CDK5RAP1 n=1 Tax=Petromyzon marinus TaxID=7757 RepID=A0AAJ7UCY6_PETMA|nr:CDK5 regulatory subunit-associated protein 1 [Petromyzon marinus]XP_032832489.1 CDK5 regulatory subunit-associated protein 1 [Petromyzon marinus]
MANLCRSVRALLARAHAARPRGPELCTAATPHEHHHDHHDHARPGVSARDGAGKPARRLGEGPSLRDFVQASVEGGGADEVDEEDEDLTPPYLRPDALWGHGRKVYFETYGCQMNTSDTEIAWAILQKQGYFRTDNLAEADVILAVTCAIRDKAEQTVWRRVERFRHLKRERQKRGGAALQIGILGCMAERLKRDILDRERAVDVVAGPDAYRGLPHLLARARSHQEAIDVALSVDETYADVVPLRADPSAPSAFVSVMRGCNNMCTYCIVPFTRGRERSRPLASVLAEVGVLLQQGVKEVVLLGQNVNSYCDTSQPAAGTPPEGPPDGGPSALSRGFGSVCRRLTPAPDRREVRFAELLAAVSELDPEMRVRFTSPHPKDFPDEVLQVIRERPNICKQIHLPAQSGSSSVLARMGRGHTREAYMELVHHIRDMIPGVSLSSDFIAGFCDETESDHEDSLSLIRAVGYDTAFLFAYSMRKKTRASHRLRDDVPPSVKQRRLSELIAAFRESASDLNAARVGSTQLVLVEGASRRSQLELSGRTDGNARVVFPDVLLPDGAGSPALASARRGDYVAVKITSSSSQSLRGTALHRTTLREFHATPDDAPFPHGGGGK